VFDNVTYANKAQQETLRAKLISILKPMFPVVNVRNDVEDTDAAKAIPSIRILNALPKQNVIDLLANNNIQLTLTNKPIQKVSGTYTGDIYSYTENNIVYTIVIAGKRAKDDEGAQIGIQMLRPEKFGLLGSEMTRQALAADVKAKIPSLFGQDPQLALTNYVAQNIVNIGKTELGKQFTSAKEAFITSKLDLEQEANNQQQIINKRNALYEEAKPVLDQYTSLADEYKNAASNITTANNYIEKNRGGYDDAMMFYNGDKAAYAKKYGLSFDNDGNLGTMGWDGESGVRFDRSEINDSFGNTPSNIERVNAEANKLKPYTDVIDKYRPTIETLRPKLEDLNTKLADYSTKFNGYDADIQASNDKITKLSDTFADKAAEFEKTSKQVGTSLVDTATSDIELAEIKRQEEAAREAVRQEEERKNT
jgi:predicted  nucleic acid-binding Zn-ribbon protein